MGGVEKNYSITEKVAFTLVWTSHKLKHTVVVLTDQPLEKIHKLDALGRMLKLAMELSDIKYKPWAVIKGQVLTDILTECLFGEVQEPTPTLTPDWQIHVDESTTAQAAGAGMLIISSEGQTFKNALKLPWKASNNYADYDSEALTRGIEMT